MGNATTVTVDQVVLMALILGVFALIGFRRGVSRELATLMGVAISFLLVTHLLDNMTPWVNKIWRMARFVVKGGLTADDPVTVWNQVKTLPALVGTDAAQRNLGAIVFALLVAMSYYAGFRAQQPASGAMSRVLGLVLGAVNGFFIASYLFRYVLVTTKATIELSSGEMREAVMSGQTIGRILTVLVVALIALGLYGASRGRSS